MSWLRAIPFLFTLLAFVLQPASASAFGNAHPEARVSAFELMALASVGASAETSPGLHEGIAEAYDENASGYRFAAGGVRPLVYGPSAGGELAATAERLGGETLTALEKPMEMGWEAFSKQTLDAAAASGRPVIFDLTHMEDIPGILNGTGRFANTVTGAELRYIQANWARFQGNVTFLGGAVPW